MERQWRRQWQPTPVLLPGKSCGWRSLVAGVCGAAKSWTRLSDFTFTFHFHALEKEMATHSSVLAWRIPGTGGAWWAAVYGVAQSRKRLKWLSCSGSSSSGKAKHPQRHLRHGEEKGWLQANFSNWWREWVYLLITGDPDTSILDIIVHVSRITR